MPHPPYKAWAFSAGLWWSLGQTEPHNKSTHIMHFKSISPNIPSNVKESFFLPLLQHTPHCFCLLFFSDYFLFFLVHKTSVICRHSVFTWRDSQQVPLTKKKGGGAPTSMRTPCQSMTWGSHCSTAQCLAREGFLHQQLIKQCFVW